MYPTMLIIFFSLRETKTSSEGDTTLHTQFLCTPTAYSSKGKALRSILNANLTQFFCSPLFHWYSDGITDTRTLCNSQWFDSRVSVRRILLGLSCYQRVDHATSINFSYILWNFSSLLAHSAAPQSFSFDYFTLTLISRSFPPLCPLSLSVLSFLFILLLLSSLSPLLLHPPLHPPHPLSSHRSFLCLAVSQCWPSLSHFLSILQNSFFSSYYLFLSDSSSISSLSSLGSLTSSLWPRSVKYR